MYVTNPENYDKTKLYECNGVVAEYLIANHISLFSRSVEQGIWYFAKTEKLQKALDEMPFWFNIKKILF